MFFLNSKVALINQQQLHFILQIGHLLLNMFLSKVLCRIRRSVNLLVREVGVQIGNEPDKNALQYQVLT